MRLIVWAASSTQNWRRHEDTSRRSGRAHDNHGSPRFLCRHRISYRRATFCKYRGNYSESYPDHGNSGPVPQPHIQLHRNYADAHPDRR